MGGFTTRTARSDRPPSLDQRIAAVAARQRGLITLDELEAVGLASAGVSARVQRGVLHRIFPAVYAVGHSALTDEAWALAAVLACGDRSCLSHRAAAWHRGVAEVLPWPIDVTVPRSGPSGFEGVRIHRPRRLHPDDVIEVRGIRVTSVERTLLDLCDVLVRDAVLRHVREAEYQGLLDPVALSALLARSNGRRGIRLLRPFAAGTSDSTGTRSELERRFKRLCREGRMPEFETQAPIVANGRRYVADFYWPDQRLVVEVDGRGGHDTVSAFEGDRVRDADFALEGILPIRLTARRIGDEPDAVLDTVRQLLVQRGWAG